MVRNRWGVRVGGKLGKIGDFEIHIRLLQLIYVVSSCNKRIRNSLYVDENAWLSWSERLDGFQRGAGSNVAAHNFLYIFLISKKIKLSPQM